MPDRNVTKWVDIEPFHFNNTRSKLPLDHNWDGGRRLIFQRLESKMNIRLGRKALAIVCMGSALSVVPAYAQDEAAMSLFKEMSD